MSQNKFDWSTLKATSGDVPFAEVGSFSPLRLLDPTICDIGRNRILPCSEFLAPCDLASLHNEALSASSFPLKACDGLFFSEAVHSGNPEGKSYFDWLVKSIHLLNSKQWNLNCIRELGQTIALTDLSWAEAFLKTGLDGIHQCYGPDKAHPYRKVTLLRTRFQIEVQDTLVDFLFEKFLTVYSYLHEGKRVSTRTPLHTHPLNFEVVYFSKFGNQSLAVEEEFEVCDRKTGLRLDFGQYRENRKSLFSNVFLRYLCSKTVVPQESPVFLDPFDSEIQLSEEDTLMLADGFFRPHRVTVHDDPKLGTFYYAINNYFSPTGNVFLFNEDGSIGTKWSHDAWQ
jgi:hypothetical protein